MTLIVDVIGRHAETEQLLDGLRVCEGIMENGVPFGIKEICEVRMSLKNPQQERIGLSSRQEMGHVVTLGIGDHS
jgi:hypothetical protein